MEHLILMKQFLIALALGALIGLEREYAKYRIHKNYYAGIRTYPLISLFGAICAYLGAKVSIWILIFGMLATMALIIAAYIRAPKEKMGTTSEIAGFLTFLIGVMCYYDLITLAIVLSISMAIILYAKSILHHFAQRIKPQELTHTLKFAVIAFMILPFLPNQGYGPMGLFNPFKFWLIVVFVCGISFVGYFVMKWVGEKGIAIAGALGGMVSSTALTSSFADRSCRQLKISQALALGVIFASGVSFIRILVLTYFLNKELLLIIILPVLIFIAITGTFGYFLWKKGKHAKGEVHLDSPFTLMHALKFSLFFIMVLALVQVANLYFSSKGVYVISFLSGFADVDAMTVSLSQLTQNGLLLETARKGIILTIMGNSLTKGIIAYFFGCQKFYKIILLYLITILLVGIGLLFLF